MNEFRAIVSGRVQMVMYRDFVARHARRYDLSGFVRNLEDGTVEVVARGERQKLERLIEDLHKGSILSSVEKVVVEWKNPTKAFGSFELV